MSCVMIGVKYKSDSRDRHLHHGNWLLKLGMWLVFVAVPFLFPNNIVDAYGKGSLIICRACGCEMLDVIHPGPSLSALYFLSLDGSDRLWLLPRYPNGHPPRLCPVVERHVGRIRRRGCVMVLRLAW